MGYSLSVFVNAAYRSEGAHYNDYSKMSAYNNGRLVLHMTHAYVTIHGVVEYWDLCLI